MRLIRPVVGILLTSSASLAGAESAGPMAVDVTVREEEPPARHFVIEWNPTALFFGKWSANILVASSNHHALLFSPFYAYTHTQPIYVYDDGGNPTQLPRQRFAGPGIELGYRYYTAQHNGPRGLFIGPAFLLGAFTATAMNNDTTSYAHLGFAVDVGYQSLIADTVSLTLGAGTQYSTPTKRIPKQQFPAWIYADGGFLPRVFLNIGVAF